MKPLCTNSPEEFGNWIKEAYETEGGMAFPYDTSVSEGVGMTLRAYVATATLAAIIGKVPLLRGTQEQLSESHRKAAMGAVRYADALLRALEE